MRSEAKRSKTSSKSRLFLPTLLLLGCSAILGVEDSKVQGACSTEAECAPGFGCLLGNCRNACSADRDCGEGSRCLRYGVTAACVPSTQGCDDGCPEGTTSCVGNVCRTNCARDTDCTIDQTCQNGVCAGTDNAHDNFEGASIAGAAGNGGESPIESAAGAGGDPAQPMAGAGAGGAGTGGESGLGGQSLAGAAGETPGPNPDCEPACTADTPVCLEGTCVACEPNAAPSYCSNAGTPQFCNDTGQWQDAAGGPCKAKESCVAGECKCSGSICDTQCVDTQTDTNHCGSCAHACAVGTCSAGKCGPVKLADSTGTPWGIAVGSGNVFWVTKSPSALIKMKLSTQEAAPMVIKGTGSGQNCDIGLSGQVIANATFVYWQSSTVCHVNYSVGGASILPVASNMYGGSANVQALAGYGSTLFSYEPFDFTIHSSDGSGYNCYFNGGGGMVDALAVDANNVYWLQTKTDGATFVYKHKAPALDAVPIELTSGQYGGEGMGVYDGYVYWTAVSSTTEATGQIRRVSTAGGAAQTLATGQLNPSGLAVDASGVYWTNRHAAGSVMRVAHAGGTAEVLASKQNGAHGIITDSSKVYWTNTEGKQVMMVSK